MGQSSHEWRAHRLQPTFRAIERFGKRRPAMYSRMILPLMLAGLSFAPSVVAEEKQEPSYFKQRVEAPKDAFELSTGVGYTQPIGMLQSGVGMPSVATAGLALDLGLAFRM